MTTCPVCAGDRGPVIAVETTPRGETFYGHGNGRWCITGFIEEGD